MSIEIVSGQNSGKNDVKRIGTLRSFFSQFVATTVKNFLLFGMGMCQAFPGIVIPALTGIPNEHNRNESLSLSAVEASWLGSVAYICEPLGSVLSALITDPIGRKRGMMIVNIPLVIAWFMMYNATAVWQIFLANTLLGLGVGLMESPVITYIGEISEPSWRGVLIAYTNVSGTLGMMLVFLLNTLMPWRTVALVCSFLPIVTVIALCFVPDSPNWLLSKNRMADAERALCWLRGWVSKDKISDEFVALQRYSQRSKSCNNCIQLNQKCPHPQPTMCEKLTELMRKQTLKPFFIVFSLFFIAEFSGITGMTPYTVQIFKAYGSPIAPDQATAVMSAVNNLANIIFLCLIRFSGKRKLYLTMLTVIFVCSAIVSVYGFVLLPVGYNSFDKSGTILPENANFAYIPFVCIILWSFCSYCGVNSVPWQMLSEVYPFKVRGAAAGISAALDYVLSFISTKSYYNLETSLSMAGISALNCAIAAGGVILIYKIMPETENRTLEDIERHFWDKSKKLTDRKIARVSVEHQSELGNENMDEVNNKSSETLECCDGKNKTLNGCDNRNFILDA